MFTKPPLRDSIIETITTSNKGYFMFHVRLEQLIVLYSSKSKLSAAICHPLFSHLKQRAQTTVCHRPWVVVPGTLAIRTKPPTLKAESYNFFNKNLKHSVLTGDVNFR